MNTRSAKALLKKCDEVSGILKSLSHPVRLKILCQLVAGESSVGELTDFCGISQSAMSQFLTRMKKEGMVTSRRDHNFMYYSVADQSLVRLLQSIREIYC